MSYISREQLIDDILNEDLGLISTNSPRKRANIVVDTNDINNSDKKHSKGGQSRKEINNSLDIFRKPGTKEIQNIVKVLNINPTSDDQTNQIRGFSKVLFDFDLLDRIYGSKKTDWNEGKTNHRQIDNSIKNIERELSKRYAKNMDAPIEDLAELIQNSTDSLNQEFGINVLGVINDFSNWRDILIHDAKDDNVNFPKGYNKKLMEKIKRYAPSDYKEIYRNLNEYLLDKSTQFKTPHDLGEWIVDNQTLHAILNEPVVRPIFNKAMSSSDVQTVEELMLMLNKNLKKARVEPNFGHTMAHINNVARKRSQYFDLMMKRKGYKDGVGNWKDIIDFLEKYKPNTYDRILKNYDLTGEQLRSFGSGRAFCDYLFSNPERLWKIIEPLQGEKSGKGVEMSVMHRTVSNKEQKVRNMINQGAQERGRRGPRAASVDELKEKIADRERISAELSAKLKEVAKKNNLKSAAERKEDPEYIKIYNIKAKADKEAAAYRLTLKKRLAAIEENGGELPQRKTLEDELAELRDEREKIEDNAYNRLKDDSEMELFRQQYNRQKTRDAAGDYDIASGYRTMSFSLKVSPNDTEAVDIIINYLDKTLNKKEIEAGKESLINVDYEPGKYDGGMRMYPCVRIVIDYPESSALFKHIKSTPKNERGRIVGEIIQGVFDKVQKELGANIGLVTKDPDHKIKIAAKNEASYSFRD